MKNYLNAFYLLATSFFIQSCCGPASLSNPNTYYPQSVTETHTKTTLVAPPSYNMPYLPPSAIYQSAPVSAPTPQLMPMQTPICQPAYQAAPCQPQAYASPVCPPMQFQSFRQDPCQSAQMQAYPSDPCNPNLQTPIRYNVVGTAANAQPQYIVVHPNPVSQSLQLQGPRPVSSDNEDTR